MVRNARSVPPEGPDAPGSADDHSDRPSCVIAPGRLIDRRAASRLGLLEPYWRLLPPRRSRPKPPIGQT